MTEPPRGTILESGRHPSVQLQSLFERLAIRCCGSNDDSQTADDRNPLRGNKALSSQRKDCALRGKSFSAADFGFKIFDRVERANAHDGVCRTPRIHTRPENESIRREPVVRRLPVGLIEKNKRKRGSKNQKSRKPPKPYSPIGFPVLASKMSISIFLSGWPARNREKISMNSSLSVALACMKPSPT